MDALNKSVPKPVMGVQGILSGSGSNNNSNAPTTNPISTSTTSSFHTSTIPAALSRPPIVITSPSPHASPASVQKAKAVSTSVSTPNTSQAPLVSTSGFQVQSSTSTVSVSGAAGTKASPATATTNTISGSAVHVNQTSPAYQSTKPHPNITTPSVSRVQANPSPVSASGTITSNPIQSTPANPSSGPSVILASGVRVEQAVPAPIHSVTSGVKVSQTPTTVSSVPDSKGGSNGDTNTPRPIGSDRQQPNIPYAGRVKSGLSGFVRLEHPIGPADCTDSGISGKESKKEPGQPSCKQLINQNNNLQNQNLINQSGIQFSKVPSSVTTPASASISSPQLPPSSSGTNPVLATKTTNPKNSSAPLNLISTASGKVGTKMESTTGLVESATEQVTAGSVSKDVNRNLMTDSVAVPAQNNNLNEKVLTNGKSETVKANASISVESNDLSDGSIPASISSSEAELPSRPVTAPACFSAPVSEMKVGKDVEILMSMLEKSGLCGPPIPMETQSAPSSRPGTAGGDKTPSRPGTAELKSNLGHIAGGDCSEVRPGSARKIPVTSRGGDLDHALVGNGATTKAKGSSRSSTSPGPTGKKESTPSKSETRPSTASGTRVTNRPPSGARSRPSTGSVKSPAEKSANTPNGNAADAVPRGTPKDGSGGKSTPNSTTTTPVEPKSAKSPRMSTPRAASARVSTAQSSTKSLDEESKLKRRKSSVGNTPQETGLTRAKSAISANSTTPRSRPSSTLYQHTASSAQKGIHTPSPSATALGNSVGASPSPSTPKTSRSSTRPRTSNSKMGDSAANAGAGDGKPATLKDQFALFSRFGDTSSDGKHISLSNCDKWMKQAHVIDPKKITTTDTSICFKKLFKTAKKVSFEDFQKYVEDLAKSKKVEPQPILDKLTNCGAPGLSTATKAAHAGVVERLTDTSKYTGSHKERFDASGKGKGIEGRRDVADGSGYVSSFKTKLDLNKSDSKESPAPVKVPHSPAQAKEASPAK